MFTDYFDAATRTPAVADGERVLTLDELARRFRVSKKTVSRWRRWGLVSRRFLCDGRPRIGFLQSSVDRFVADNAERVRRGARFSRLTDEQRHQMIERARSLALAGDGPAEVVGRIAREIGRTPETVRGTLKRFDLKHPGTAIFPAATASRRPRRSGRFSSNTAVAIRCRRWPNSFTGRRAASTRIINEMRAARIMEMPLESMDNEQFAAPALEKQEAKILRAAEGKRFAGEEAADAQRHAPVSGQPVRGAAADARTGSPSLPEDELPQVQGEAGFATRSTQPAQSRLMDQIEKLYEESVATKNQIIRANLRLVVSIAKRYVGQAEEFFELVSDGNMSLIRAVEKFDVSRGFRFSTYASWAIMKNFARTIPAALRYRDRFRNSDAEMFSTTEDARTDQYEQESAQVRASRT